MRHEVIVPMQARLAEVRDLRQRMERIKFADASGRSMAADLAKEEKALGEALFGDDPLCRRSLQHLRSLYLNHALVPMEEDGPKIRLGGNESWAFAEVVCNDDYGREEFGMHFAIWRNTGCLYRTVGGRGHEVVDDPFFVPEGSDYGGPIEKPKPHQRTTWSLVEEGT